MTTEFQALIIERDSLAATNLAAFMQAARDGRVPVSEPVFGNVRDAIIKRAVRRHRIQESRVLCLLTDQADQIRGDFLYYAPDHSVTEYKPYKHHKPYKHE